jgi:valyl-tRNA synthetase
LLASDFSKKAPESVIEKEKEKLNNFIVAANKIEAQLASMG